MRKNRRIFFQAGLSFLAGSATSISVAGTIEDCIFLKNYNDIREYIDNSYKLYITTPGIHGLFERVSNEFGVMDDGGINIFDKFGRQWKRVFDGEINVSWYEPDKTGGVDSSRAFQSAFNSKDGNSIYIPSGRFLLKNAIKFIFSNKKNGSSAIKVRGEGIGKTILISEINDGAVFEVSPAIDISKENFFFCYGGYIKNLSIEGSLRAQNSDGINMKSCWNVVIDMCSINNLSGSGVVIKSNKNINPDYTASSGISVKNTRITNCEYGIYAPTGNSAPFLNISEGSYICFNRRVGVYACSSYLKISESSVSGNGTNYSLDGSFDEGFGGVVVPISDYEPKGIQIIGSEFDNNIPQQIYIAQAKSPIIKSNSIQTIFLKNKNYINRHAIVLGAAFSVGKKRCEDYLIESNNFQFPNLPIDNSHIVDILLINSYCSGGFIGVNSYSMIQGVPGINFSFIKEERHPIPFDEERFRPRCLLQGGVKSLRAYNTQYINQSGTVNIAGREYFSFRPIDKEGDFLLRLNNKKILYKIVYSVGAGGNYVEIFRLDKDRNYSKEKHDAINIFIIELIDDRIAIKNNSDGLLDFDIILVKS